MKELEDLHAYIRRKHEELVMLCAVKSKEDELKEAEERGAREMAQVVCDECKRCQDAGEAQAISLEELMQLWKERKK